jgi:hypothetical protein
MGKRISIFSSSIIVLILSIKVDGSEDGEAYCTCFRQYFDVPDSDEKNSDPTIMERPLLPNERVAARADRCSPSRTSIVFGVILQQSFLGEGFLIDVLVFGNHMLNRKLLVKFPIGIIGKRLTFFWRGK